MANVLVVEDADELAELLVRELKSEGHEVARAEDGERALILFDRDRPDVVVLDWMLLGWTELRSSGRSDNAPTLRS